jgi:hypothetical protein
MKKMTFNQFNEPWIERMVSAKKFILNQGAIQKMQKFLTKYDSSLPTLPIPLIIERDCYETICNASKLLIKAQAKIMQFLMSLHSQEEILKMFNLTPLIKSLIDWEELKRTEEIIGRFDIIPSNNGYQFCEINVDSATGGLKLFDCFQEYSNVLNLSFSNKTTSPRKNIAKYLREIVLKHKFERVVIFSAKQYLFDGSGTVNSLFNCVVDAIPEVPVLLLDEESYPDNLLLNTSESKKTLIYRMAIYSDVNFHPLLSKIFDSGATIVNKFENEIRSNKNWFAIFHDSKYHKLLTEQERSAIVQFIPRSFLLSQENFEGFLKDKERYVFKLNRSYGGAGVFIGADNDTEFLREVLSDLSNCIAQEIVKCENLWLPENELFVMKPHKIVFGLFHALDKQSGILIRANTKGNVISMSHGAKIGWAYPCSIEEREYLMKYIVHS